MKNRSRLKPRPVNAIGLATSLMALLCSAPVVQAAGPIPLEGFETPSLAPDGYAYKPAGSAWTFSGTNGSGIQHNGSAWGGAAAPEGQQTAFLHSGDAHISQMVYLTAGVYNVSFYAARRPYGQEVANPIQVKINDIPVSGAITPAGTTFAKYTSNDFPLSTSGYYKVELMSTNNPWPVGDTFIDQVVVNPVGAATFALGVTKSGSGTVSSVPAGINCGTTCSASFASGTQVALTATPASGYTFDGWSGACTGISVCNVTMNAAAAVTATFKPVVNATAKYVPLTLAAGPAASAVPVRSGIPFPSGALTSVANLRLESADGSQEIPAQFDAISKWPDGSVKVALLHVVTDLGAARNYRVAYGPGVTRTPLPRPVSVTGTPATEIVVDTGAIKFAVNKQGLLAKLWRDVNANGAFESNEQIIDSGEMFMVNAFDNKEYTASAAQDAVVTIEENGPMRTVIKAQGSLTNGTGVLTKYLVRYYASQGSDKVDIETTIIDDRLEANVEKVGPNLAISAKALGMRWHYLSDGAPNYRFGGENGAAYSGTVSGEHFLSQGGKFSAVTDTTKGELLRSFQFGYSGVGSGSKAPGWVAVDSGTRHMALMVKDFWQQFPNELNINGNTLTANLFPARAVGAVADTVAPAQSGNEYRRPNTLYFNRQGGAKTYQLRLAFGDTTAATPALHSMNDSYQRHRLDLMAAPSWYTASGVFGDLNVGGSTAAASGYSAGLMRNIYEPSFEKAPELGKEANMFGWRDYGNRLRGGWAVVQNGVRVPSFYNDTHVGANNFFKEFLRTGDQRWYGLADIATRHFMDLGVHHGPRAGYWSTGGLPQPAGEVHAVSHENIDHEGRNLHWGHTHVSGLSDTYLLTGDKRALDVLNEIGNWWKFVSPYFFKMPFAAGDKHREAERDYAWPLYAMNEYVRVTGDADYHKNVSANLANYLVQWWQTPMNHIGFNPTTGLVSNTVIGVNDASKGTGYWTMTKMDNGGGYNATGTNPWMAGALISNIIKFYEQDKQFAAAGKASGVSHPMLKDMLLQGMNYVVKYGYDSAKQYFTYSEAVRYYSGGDNHLIYGLGYLDRLYKQELAAGRIANPQWYDTQPTWGTIARRRYDQLQNTAIGSSTQSYGFYGYEIVYPADFFKVMQDTLGY